MDLLSTFQLENMTIKNRVVMAPMCMFQVKKHDGRATDFHRLHYGARALGGVGLIIVESTGVSPEGRITDNDLGLYEDKQIDKLKEIVEDAHAFQAKIAVQLNHAGRKSQCVDGVSWIYAPSAIAFSENSRVPVAMSEADILKAIHDFKQAAIRAEECGFDGIELHAAHGFLLHQFMSKKTNRRTDQYGNPAAFLSEVVKAVKGVFSGSVWIRISSTDYAGGTVEDIIQVISCLGNDICCVHVSSGGLLDVKPQHVYPGYQLKDAFQIRKACQLPVIGVGLLEDFHLASYLIETDQLDLVALGRGLLKNPNWVFDCALFQENKSVIEPSYQQAYKNK